MKLTTTLATLAMGLTILNVTVADDVPPVPVPDGVGEVMIGEGVPTDEPIELFACVKVEDRDNIHPCAVPMIVAVADPCDPCCGCRYVMICVPPSDCCKSPKIETSRRGTKVEYDYGEYEVEIKSGKDFVLVNYDD